MKRFQLLRLLIVTVGVSGCAASPHLTPVSFSNQLLVYNGFSALAPLGDGWSIVTPVKPPFTTGLSKKGRSEMNTITATITVGNMHKLPPEELFKLSEMARKEEFTTGRFSLLLFNASRQKYQGADCQRIDSTAEDRGMSGYPGMVFILETHGFSCIHPDVPTAFIDIEYSQRRLRGEQPVYITDDGEALMTSLQFRPMVRPFVSNAIEVTGSPQTVAPGHGSLWVTRMSDNVVARITSDMAATTATIKVGNNPVGLAVTDTDVWVANSGSDTVSRIDAGSNQVVATVNVGSKPLLVAAAFGSIWVTNSGEETVSRIDPGTNTVTATVKVGRHPSGLGVAGNAVWVTNFSDDTVQRINPTTGRTQGQPIAVGRGPSFLTGDRDSVWVNNQNDDTVFRIDAATDRITARVSSGSTLGGLSAGHGLVWVADFKHGNIIRIDPRLGRTVDPPIRVGISSLGVTATPDAVFVIDVTAGLLFRIEP